jgi:hypothetical protein
MTNTQAGDRFGGLAAPIGDSEVGGGGAHGSCMVSLRKITRVACLKVSDNLEFILLCLVP